MSDGQNLTLSVTGNTDSKVVISSTGTSQDAIRVETTNGTGGIYLNSAGAVQLESNNSNSGVLIATSNPGVPVKIGTPNSTTTIMGNLEVKGVTTTVESQVVTIDDNIIVVNNAPSGTSDGGLAVKRYQNANDSGHGDVVMDTPDGNGTVQNGSNTLSSIRLAMTASNVDDFYNGWWVKITSGTGAQQVRRIKSYNGSTKVANIYTTSDQTTLLDNPTPVEGLDFTTVPDVTSEYALYPCHYVMAIWDESRDEFALVCSSKSPSDVASFAHYSDLHINNLTCNSITATTINGSIADSTITISLNDGSSVPVSITNFPFNYGAYLVFVTPLTVTTRAHAIFMIGRINVNVTPGTVVRLLSVKGAQYDQLDMQWRANQFPELYYRPTPIGGSGTTVYKIKIVSV
jgi:hypothetical protein